MDFEQFMKFMVEMAEKAAGTKNNPTTTPGNIYNHGPGGIFSRVGDDARIFSALNVPTYGLMEALPVIDREVFGGFGGYEYEYMTTITGLTGTDYLTDAAQPTEICAEGAPAPSLKIADIVVPYNDYTFNIEAVDFKRLGLLRDAGEPVGVPVVNPPAAGANPVAPAAGAFQNILDNELRKRQHMSVLGATMYMSRKLYTANPTNSAASNNWKDGLGMDLYINTGTLKDARTGQAVAALNSRIIDANHTAADAVEMVDFIDRMIYALDMRVRRQGLGMVWDGEIFMRAELWELLSAIWPVAQYQKAIATMLSLNGGNTATNPAAGQIVINGADANAARDNIRQSMMLPVRGRFIRVRIDEAIPVERFIDAETTPHLTAGQEESDIYFIPFRILGGVPVTYLKPWRYDATVYQAARAAAGLPGNVFTSEGGAVLWATNWQNFCLDANWTTRYRLMMHTPQIAGRITNVKYTPRETVPPAFPDEPNYATLTGGHAQYGTENVYVPGRSGTVAY